MELTQKIRRLPEAVQDYLYSDLLLQANAQVSERNGLDFEQRKTFLKLFQRMLGGEVGLSGLGQEAAGIMGSESEKSKALARDIAGYCLLPLDRWIGDVSGYLRGLGGDPSKYPPDRIPLTEKTRDEAAAEVVQASFDTTKATDRVKERLQDVVKSFLAGIRTEDQAFEVLTRSDKLGGVGLDEETAQYAIDQAKEEARAVIITEKPVGGVSDVAAAVDAAAAPPPPVEEAAPAVDDFSTIKPEDEDEITRLKAAAVSSGGSDQSAETAKRIDESVERIYEASGLKTDDEAMAKRTKTVIGNRLRDVRDQMETLETLVQPKELGGLGLGQDAARALLGAIQASLTEVHETHAAKISEEKAEWVEGERQKAAEAPAKEAAAQESDLERLYSSIVAKSKKATKVAAEAKPGPSVIAQPIKAAAPPSAPIAPPNLPVNVTNPVPPEHRAPEVIPLPPAPVGAAPAAMPPQPPLTIVRPVPGVPVAAPSAKPGLGQAGRPKMEDVKGAPKLTGPVEELRAITVVDFRRLSKDPKEAVMKLKDKIDLLAEQSYTRRTEGLAAWSASEVVRTYLEQMREGLNGVPLSEAVAARQAARKPYLTPEEFQAVAELSRQLRY